MTRSELTEQPPGAILGATPNIAGGSRTMQLPPRYRDERAFLPFAAAPPTALLAGRLFYCMPHDARRRVVSRLAPQRFNALERLRAGTSAGPYSLEPFDRLRCIFVHVPKAAGVSVCRGLFGGLAGGHAHIGVYQMVFSRREFASYFKFAFVRNPWDRLFSAYAFLRDGGMDESDRRWADSNAKHLTTFENFVLNWLSDASVLTQVHFIPQYKLVCAPFTTRVAVDFVGRYEHLERDFEHVRDRLGLDKTASLPHHNTGPAGRESYDFRNHYTAEMQRLVARVYRQDIELFGYSFDEPGR